MGLSYLWSCSRCGAEQKVGYTSSAPSPINGWKDDLFRGVTLCDKCYAIFREWVLRGK